MSYSSCDLIPSSHSSPQIKLESDITKTKSIEDSWEQSSETTKKYIIIIIIIEELGLKVRQWLHAGHLTSANAEMVAFAGGLLKDKCVPTTKHLPWSNLTTS